MSLTFTDIFCGAGGSSTGLVAAGLELKLAANHWARAVETHAANHVNAEHLCADVNNYDMRRLPKTDVLWASPICTELSPAGGRRRRSRGHAGPGQTAMEEFGHVPQDAFDRTRATFWDVIRAAEVHRYKAVLVENVMEAAEWELFDIWLAGMRTLGYRHQFVSLSSAHAGGATNQPAPQWRDRIYIVLTREGIPLPDVEPRPAAWCPVCEETVSAVQSWKKPGARRLGKYAQQYVYRCPNGSRCRHAVVEPYVRPAASIINWSDLGVRIGEREQHGKRPLVPNTIKRIRAGLALFAGQPFPAGAVLAPTGGTWNTTPTTTAEPMRTRLANPKGFEALVTPPQADSFIVPVRGNAVSTPATKPLSTVTTGRSHWLVVPYRNAASKPVTEPLHTLGTVDSAALLGTAPVLEECHYRMIQPREQLLAQRFPADYIVHGNRGEQTMQAGNAVSVNAAQWLGERVLAVLS